MAKVDISVEAVEKDIEAQILQMTENGRSSLRLSAFLCDLKVEVIFKHKHPRDTQRREPQPIFSLPSDTVTWQLSQHNLYRCKGEYRFQPSSSSMVAAAPVVHLCERRRRAAPFPTDPKD